MRRGGGTCILILFLFAGCGGDIKDLRLGLTPDQVEDLIGSPEIVRRGMPYLDTTRITLIMRGSSLPVVSSAPDDTREVWVYEESTQETGSIVSRPDRKKPPVARRYVCTNRFCVVFDERGRVAYYGFFPFSVAAL